MPRQTALAALVLALAAWASPAAAQMTVTATAVDGRTSDQIRVTPIQMSGTQCTTNAKIKLQFSGIPVGTTVLDIWRGTGCNTTASRAPTTGTCIHVPPSISVGATQTMLTLDDTTAVLTQNLFDCNASEGQQTLWFLATTQSEQRGDVTTTASLVFNIDRVAPPAPTALSGGSGDSSVTLTYTAPSATDLNNYRAYVDANPGASCASSGDGGTGTGTLVEGAEAPATGFTTVAIGTSFTIDPSSYTTVGGTIAVAVAAVDKAGNVSVLSNVRCVQRVQTAGFCSRYNSAGCPKCSASPGASGGAIGALVGLGVLGLVAVRRRRRIA